MRNLRLTCGPDAGNLNPAALGSKSAPAPGRSHDSSRPRLREAAAAGRTVTGPAKAQMAALGTQPLLLFRTLSPGLSLSPAAWRGLWGAAGAAKVCGGLLWGAGVRWAARARGVAGHRVLLRLRGRGGLRGCGGLRAPMPTPRSCRAGGEARPVCGRRQLQGCHGRAGGEFFANDHTGPGSTSCPTQRARGSRVAERVWLLSPSLHRAGVKRMPAYYGSRGNDTFRSVPGRTADSGLTHHSRGQLTPWTLVKISPSSLCMPQSCSVLASREERCHTPRARDWRR